MMDQEKKGAGLRVCVEPVSDRLWDQGCAFPSEKYTRCFDWESIRRIIAEQG